MILETFTFYTFLLVFTVDEMRNISNKYQSPSNLPTQIFLHKRFYNPPSFGKKVGAVHRKSFKNDEEYFFFHLKSPFCSQDI